MDVLADILSATHAGNTVFCQTRFTAPWGMRFEPGRSAYFHIISGGDCWLRSGDGKPPLRLAAGDVVLLSHGTGHEVVDDPSTPARPYMETVREAHRISAARLPADGNGGPPRPERQTELLCGLYHFEQRGPHPLLSLLPSLVYIPADEARRNVQIQGAVALLMEEFLQEQPGSAAVISRLLDALFVLIVRAWAAAQPEGSAGWLGALSDTKVGQSLKLMHGHPERGWTIASLAQELSMSRAAFARRFADYVGEPPLAYLTRWRMNLGTRLMLESEQTLDAIAQRVGYGSEAAFSKAFRRICGISPGRYRSGHKKKRYPGDSGADFPEYPPLPQAGGPPT